MNRPALRDVPSVEKLLAQLGDDPHLPRPIVVREVRQQVEQVRKSILEGSGPPRFDEIIGKIRNRLEALRRTRLQPVINATGIVLHTNLGRSPLGAAAADAVAALARGYCNLEMDLESGERGGRGTFVEEALAMLCEAEAAAVVNNCAAALVLVLRALTRPDRAEVVVSRGELVEIGGGFRIPEILDASGARLREVGTTNKTALRDYEHAIGPHTALILKVHRSNFYIGGFTDEPAIWDLAALARKNNLPLVEDLGSGAVTKTELMNAGLEHERTPAEAAADGVDLVCFSGDKLFGGPQAGIMAGRASIVSNLKSQPLFRALRCDKLILGALEATAASHLAAAGGVSAGPADSLCGLLGARADALIPRAEALVAALGGCAVTATIGSGESRCGGGTLPRSALESVTVDLQPRERSVDALAAQLRRGNPPVIGYVEDDRLRLDLRTVLQVQDQVLASALIAALSGSRLGWESDESAAAE